MKRSARLMTLLVVIAILISAVVPAALAATSPTAGSGFLVRLTRPAVSFFRSLAPASGNWCIAGSFQGWNNSSHALADDGANGDAIPGDGVFSLSAAIAEPGRYEFKAVECGNWSRVYPAANAWFETSAANQQVVFSFDVNTYATAAALPLSDWLPASNIVQIRGDTAPAAITAVGDWQATSWTNNDPATALTNLGRGRFFGAFVIPAAGNYNGKAVKTGSWDGFGADGRSADAKNIAFVTTTANQTVYFLLDLFYNQVSVRVAKAPAAGNWCAAGSFQGWNNSSHALTDDGSNGDLIAGDGVFARDIVVADAGRYEFKAVECGNWSKTYPSNNAWFHTAAANQTVKISFDTNTYGVGAAGVTQAFLVPNTNIVNVGGDSSLDSFTIVGDFQGWNNADPNTLMTPLGMGRFVGHASIAAPGNHIGKVTRTGSWDAFSRDGRNADAPNLEITTTAPNQDVYFFLDTARGQVEYFVPGAGPTPTPTPTPPPPAEPVYAVIHYNRPAADYGTPSSDFNTYWGLHLWGDGLADGEGTQWTSPRPFAGVDDGPEGFGAYVAIKLKDPSKPVNYIIHKGSDKDTSNDRSFNPSALPTLWLKQGDAANYGSRAAVAGKTVVHYRRPGGDYDGWGLHLWGDGLAPGQATDWANPKLPDGTDDYGAYFTINLSDASKPVNLIVHKGDAKDPDADRSYTPAQNYQVWLQSGQATVYKQRGAAEGYALIHYRRTLGDYNGWGLHVWEDADEPGVTWANPLQPAGQDAYGIYWKVRLKPNPTKISFIIHKGDQKDPGPDESMTFAGDGFEIWKIQESGKKYLDPAIPTAVLSSGAVGDLGKQQAHWVSRDTIAWAKAAAGSNVYTLHYDANAGLSLKKGGIEGGQTITLTYDPAGLSDAIKAKFPHLASLGALKIAASDLDKVPDILKGQFAIQSKDAGGALLDATGLQIPGVLDDLFTYGGALGVAWEGDTPVVRVWAPTAQSVRLLLFPNAYPETEGIAYPLYFTPDSGVWTVKGEPSWKGQYYLYEVKVFAPSTGKIETNLVTDPYSLSLALNSKRTQIINLADPALTPDAWSSLSKPPLAAPEDISIYELHVRDFSVNDPSVPADLKGTYKAFTLPNSNGVKHLKALQAAGLTHLHLLPVFDIATIDENKANWQQPDPAVLATYPPDSEEQQKAVVATENLDGFNWGYDPFHYTVPEGSYSTNPDGPTRIVEFRDMVGAINRMGLRVVMDVVYNHTNAAGQAPNSVLDRIVPGYYHRLNANGQVESSTCCANTASEHAMFEKLMIDSLVTWAKYYKIDAFRFDLMGHHMVSNMQHVRQALDALTLADDGVDGKSIYLYGEGWNFGEVADNARGANATQLNLAGAGIGTFNDRSRDAARGPRPFDSGEGLKKQGFASGLYYDPNASNQGTAAEQKERLLLLSDQIRVGMTGNLSDYTFQDRTGALVKGSQVDYNGSPTGYTKDPQEAINYVEKHDNQTLFDIYTYGIPAARTMADRVRAQNVGLATVFLGEGVPFVQAGADLLRSKSFDRDSYNSGDWFNKIDWTYQANNFGVGLPVAGKNAENWPIMQPLLANPALKPGPSDIALSRDLFQELLKIRTSSPLFRLRTAQDVQSRLTFLNTGLDQLPGLIVMALSDRVNPDLDPNHDTVVVLLNANDESQTFTSPFAGMDLQLHPVQQHSVDAVVKTAAFDANTGVFTLPARTAAVFVEPEPTPITVTLPLLADTWVNGGQKTTNFNDYAALIARTTGLDNVLLVFDRSPLPIGAEIVSASLDVLTTLESGTKGKALAVLNNVAPFDPTKVTYATAPGVFNPGPAASVRLGAITIDAKGQVATCDRMDQQEHLGGKCYLAITAAGPLGRVAMQSLESWPRGQQPRLTVSYMEGTGVSAGDAALARPAVQSPIQDEVMYFVMTDRFYNGDPGNDRGGDSGDADADVIRHGYRVADKAFYHGGDLAGLASKLDYLKSLGITSIWITPPFTNRPTQQDGSTDLGVGAGYHGYWIRDWLNTDPHLGTNQQIKALIDSAHGKGIKVFFDIVANHSADYILYENSNYSYRSKADYPYKDANGQVFDDSDYAGGTTFPPLDPAISFPYKPFFPSPTDATAKNPPWLNNPIYYHNRGNSTFRGENSLYGDFFGLDDLFTEQPTVVAGFEDIFKYWIREYNIDGYRIDTVKHVNMEFWQQLAPNVMNYAQSLGKTNFTMFGEVFDSNPSFMSQYTTAGRLPTVVDFGLQSQATNFAANSDATDKLRDYFFQDDYFTDADSNAYSLGNFISNHDIGRLGRSVRSANAGASDAEDVARVNLGYALIYFARGFPIVYYGDEQGFISGGGDKLAREDMMASRVPEYNAYDLIGTDATTAVDNFDQNHPIYKTLATYADLLKQHKALRRGAQIHRTSEAGAGIYAFSRIDRDERVEYIVALNNAETPKSATFATFSPGVAFDQIFPVTVNPVRITTGADGQITVQAPALGVAIFRAAKPMPASAVAPTIALMQPGSQGKVNGRPDIVAQVPVNQMAEVSFAVKVGDATTFTPLGTDTNPPYRVFYDVSGLPVGTQLVFKAIVDDLNGHLNMALTSATVVEPPKPPVQAGYAIIHYHRPAGDYAGWGLHLWGEGVDESELPEWSNPKQWNGEDSYGVFAFIKIKDPSKPVSYIIHKGDEKDTPNDRSFTPADQPEFWAIQDKADNFASAPAALGYVVIHYKRPAGDYDGWGLHLWGDAIDPSEATQWGAPKLPTGTDDYGAFFQVKLVDPSKAVNFIIHKGDDKDTSNDRIFTPNQTGAFVWLKQGDAAIYRQRGAAEGYALLHYRRTNADYGDYASANAGDFWGLHLWGDTSESVEWTRPLKPVGQDRFGVVFKIGLKADPAEIGYILHRGDTKDPGPDQSLNFARSGFEVWQLQGADPNKPYLLPR